MEREISKFLARIEVLAAKLSKKERLDLAALLERGARRLRGITSDGPRSRFRLPPGDPRQWNLTFWAALPAVDFLREILALF